MHKLFSTTLATERRYSLAVFIGIIAGFISALVKSGSEEILPPRSPNTIPPPVELLEKLGVHVNEYVYTFSDQTVAWAGNAVHILFSIVIAVMYCFLSEIFPKVRMLQGVIFGLIIAIGAHGIILPILGLSSTPFNVPIDGIISELIGTPLWIWTIEIIRRDLRNRITKLPDPQIA
ncbi:DUF1440 domain-containing protein [Ignatzschineria rhizosphaerae]|uniref:DUF1440 domain-containing protein n=1 Tax=Ignatzschineria rhizosphaerae TaxID=2923279 RepID=A0ABY3WYD6_9GAMM|nr:DUF1440 domain-containing protein [Ignatzschineria rhizosphaerae]UNM95633.1 DUF1440 domain-containing protein [Ignatzschineria rhizosphaerae]